MELKQQRASSDPLSLEAKRKLECDLMNDTEMRVIASQNIVTFQGKRKEQGEIVSLNNVIVWGPVPVMDKQ